MAAHDSDGEGDFVTYGKPLELYEEGEQPKKPVPLQDQTVKDEKGRYKRFHGAFMGGFSAGYYNTVGSKEGWTPSTFVSSRQGKSERHVSRPEDFMDDEDLGEFGIAPNEIVTTDEFASKTKDRIREKAKELASVTAPIPGATILEDLIAPAKITMGVQLLRQMGWKEGQGVGPRVKRRAKKPGGDGRMYGCALPHMSSEDSEDAEDDYVPENITFAPKDVTPIDFTVKNNVHGLGYHGLNPHQALFGSVDTRINLFSDTSENTSRLLGDVRPGKGRKVGISGQAFGIGALEDEDDDIYSVDPLSKYDTVLRDEETGDGLFGWTAPKEYKNKGSSKELQYIGKMLAGFCLATQSPPSKKLYPAPDLPRDYRPVHYFRPILAENSQNSTVLQAMIESSLKPSIAPVKEQLPSRHQLNSSQRREMLGEVPLQGPTSVLELLSEKDRERIQDVKQNLEEQRSKAQKLAQEALNKRFQSSAAQEKDDKFQRDLLDRQMVPEHAEEFRPFDKIPEKQKRYENYIRSLHKGHKADALDSCLDASMTEWERSREREEFMRSAMLYKPTNSHLSSRFTRAKYEDDVDKVEVPRDQEGDMNDKAAAVKMKMFGKLTRDKYEWHPDRLLCKRFNIPDPYPGSTIIGLPKIKRDKYSVFNFLTIPETPPPTITSARPEKLQQTSENKPKKSSRWDMSVAEEKKKDSISEFLSLARSKSEVIKEDTDTKQKDSQSTSAVIVPAQSPSGHAEQDPEEEEKRPSIDLFKAIFAESSDEKSSSSDEESDENSLSVPNADTESSKSEAVASSSVQEPESTVKLLAPPAVPVANVDLETMDTEEFGPKLPPVQPSSSPPKSSTYSLESLNEPTKKQKHKKHKEKHKVKKEHKHKKEKKKKHKKQKHKSKQKSRKIDDKSTDTDDSSDSPSDTENKVDITPRELLKRLKNLPIPHSQR